MAGSDPMDLFNYKPPAVEPDISPDVIKRKVRRRLAMQEAMRSKISGYDVAVPDEPEIPAVAEEEIEGQKPIDLNTARDGWKAAKEAYALEAKQLEDFITQTDSIMPVTEEAARAINERAKVIARARKDYARKGQFLDDIHHNLTQAEFAATANPPAMPELVNQVGKKLGFLKPLLNLLNAPAEAAAGAFGTLANLGADIGLLPNHADADTDMTVGDWLSSPLAVIDPDHKLRKRGRETGDKVGQSFEVLGDLFAETSVSKAFESASGYDVQKSLGKITGGTAQLGFELALDPLNLLEFGPVTKVGKLRQLARVNAGALETVATWKAMEDVAQIGKVLGKDAWKSVQAGTLSNDLVRVGKMGADEATALAQAYDKALTLRLTNYRAIAGTHAKSFADQMTYELQKVPETKATKAQKDAMKRIHEFGDKVDPINGRSVREQISLGQRGRVLRALQQKFGDQTWYKKLGDPWAFITGMSLKHDIADVPEVFAAYTAFRIAKGNIGAEALRLQQDTVEGAAKLLRGMEDAEKADIEQRLPGVVEKIRGQNREMMRKTVAEADSQAASARVRDAGARYKAAREGYDDAAATGDMMGEQKWRMERGAAKQEWEAALEAERAAKLAHVPERQRLIENTLLDLADLYDTDAKVLRAIGNRFNLKIMDLAGEFGYFKRRFVPELDQFLAETPDARAWFGNHTTKQSRDNLNQLLDAEHGRKLREFDFYDAEQQVLKQMKAMGYTGDRVWSRDAFGDIARSAEEVARTAEVRSLYNAFVDAVGKMNPESQAALAAKVSAEEAENAIANNARVVHAQRKLEEAKVAQEGFREGRDALRKAEGRADTLQARLGAAEGRAQEVRIVGKESGVESPAAYQAGRDAQNRAVIAAEALKAEATDLVSKTPGAADARKALVQARKILASAKTTEAMELAAKELSIVTGGTSTGTDLVSEAEQLVKLAQDYIKANPDIADADKALRVANAMLADAREVAARVEVDQLSKHLADLTESAQYSKLGSAEGGAFLTNAMLNELRKARKVAGDVKEYYRLRDAQKAAVKAGDKALAADIGKKAKEIPHKSIREVRSALSTMRAELRKDAPKALVNLLESAYDRANNIAGLLDDAAQAVAKPVAGAVNQTVRDAEKHLEFAMEAQKKGDMATWTGDQRADWVAARHKVTQGNVSAIQVLKDAKVPLPEDMESLIRLATTEFTPAQGRQFKRLADGTIWEHINTPTKILQLFDIIKTIYQKTALSWFPSVAKDNRGTVINLAMSGAAGHLRKSVKTLGKFENWRKGGKVPDVVNRLRGEGVLKTTISEATQREPGALRLANKSENKAEKVALKILARVEERGVMGAMIPGKTGENVADKLDALLDWRVYVEESGRLATYLKSIDDGFSHAEAVEEVYKWYGKFDELSKFERNVMNRIMFFWAWQARSIPIAVRHILAHPVRSKMVLNMTAGDATEDETMPPWLRRMGGWMLGRNENGSVDVINTGGTYFDPMISMFQGNFANEVMQGRPFDAVQAGLEDVARSMPPHLQAVFEGIASKDLFTTHDWWANRNAETDSNAKAPTVFWYLHGDNAISKTLGLQPVKTRGDEGQYLVMDPRWSWFFGALPGVETRLNDVSSFFSSPLISDGPEPAPRITPVRGAARHLGFPLYEVPLENGKRQVFELKNAIAKDADALVGGSLISVNSKVVPSKTFRGQALRGDMERWSTYAKEYLGMTPTQREQYVNERVLKHYPQEGRVLMLQARVEAWERHLINVEKYGTDLDPEDAKPLNMAIRRAATSRVSEWQAKQDKKRLDKLELKPR